MRQFTIAVALLLAGTLAAPAADYSKPKPVVVAVPKVVVKPPKLVVAVPKLVEEPKVVDYPAACGLKRKSPFNTHCYGGYRPWAQPGCYWRHGYYVCPPVAYFEDDPH